MLALHVETRRFAAVPVPYLVETSIRVWPV
jgi:hypothetical protein